MRLLSPAVGGQRQRLFAGRPIAELAAGREPMEMALTAVFKKVPEGYIGFVEELPGANTQGATLEEVRENLREAVELVLEANRALAREEAGQGEVIREPLKIAAG
jgi:predicted RNase H-like HicB family nuclease